MLLFSKKFLSLLVVLTLTIGGERHSAEGGTKRCFRCIGNGADIKDPVCNANHDGETEECRSDYGNACAMINDGGVISKFCEKDPVKWSHNGTDEGNPICIKNQRCYCNDGELCNRKKDFGFDEGTGGGGGGTDKSGSFGKKDMFPARSILFWLMATIAVTLVPSICIPTK